MRAPASATPRAARRGSSPNASTPSAPRRSRFRSTRFSAHAMRLPSFTVSTEALFAAKGERLSIRHDAGESAAPYVAGTLLAIRAVPGRIGLTRGLDQLL